MRFLFALLFALGVPVLASASPAPSVSATEDNVAIGGYDPVGYFTEGRPVPGSTAFTLRWNGATWRFASAGSRTRFEANPGANAPAFGGYCAWAISQNYIAPGDPLVWRIVDGRLYLNFNRRAQLLWETDLAGAIARGNANWPNVLATAENR